MKERKMMELARVVVLLYKLEDLAHVADRFFAKVL